MFPTKEHLCHTQAFQTNTKNVLTYTHFYCSETYTNLMELHNPLTVSLWVKEV